MRNLMVNQRLTTYLLLLITAIVCGCATQQKPITVQHELDTAEEIPSAASNGLVKLSNNKKFRVSIESDITPPPINQIHTWQIRIETLSGEPVTNAIFFVDGGMPAHKHGFPTNPKVSAHQGGGLYYLEGMKFNMSGRWVLKLGIVAANVRDKVKFDINL